MWRTSYGNMTSGIMPMVPGTGGDDAPADMKLKPRPGQPHLGHTGTVSTWTQDIRDELQTTVEQKLASNINSQEAMRVQQKTSGIQQMRQSETNAALAVKIGNTKEQLEKAQAALKMVEDELALLQGSLDVVIDTDASKDAPIISSEHTLQRRLDRPASEMTYDEVTRKLHSQIVCLKQTKQWMSQAREAHVKEIEVLLDCQYFLRNDITDKLSALRIDEDCLGLDNDKVDVPETERPTDLPFYPTASSTINISALGSPRYQTGNSREWAGNGLVRPITWATNTKVVVEQAKVTCATGGRLREKSIKLAETGMANEEAIHEDLMGSVVGIVQGIRVAVNKMEESCNTLLDAIKEKRQLTADLQQSIDDKEAPALVVQQRMNLRGQRPDMEMVEDPVQKALYQEWRDITKGSEELKEKYKKSIEDTEKFITQFRKIEADLQLKMAFLKCEEDVYSIQSSWRDYTP